MYVKDEMRIRTQEDLYKEVLISAWDEIIYPDDETTKKLKNELAVFIGEVVGTNTHLLLTPNSITAISDLIVENSTRQHVALDYLYRVLCKLVIHGVSIDEEAVLLLEQYHRIAKTVVIPEQLKTLITPVIGEEEAEKRAAALYDTGPVGNAYLFVLLLINLYGAVITVK